MEEEMTSMTQDEVLPYVMWTVATAVLVVNIIVLILGVVQKREIPVDAFLIHNLLFCYLLLCLHPYVILTMNIILNHRHDEVVIKALCSFASFVGVATSTMCMLTMVTLASSFLLRLLLPRRFKNLKSYLNALRIVLIAEWVLVGLFAVVPLIPFPVFAEAQETSKVYLCLPLHTMLEQEPMWIYTLVLASMDGLSIIVLLMLIVVTACQLHKQQRHNVGVTPMEARVIQKNAALVKRVGLMMLSTVAFRFPGVVAIFGANLNVSIPTVVFQWVFGIVLPFSGIIGPVIYVFYAGLEDTTLEACWHSCRKKAVKGGSALRVGLGQLARTVPPSRASGHGKGTDIEGALTNGMGPHTHDTLPRGSNRAPSEASWVEHVIMQSRPENFGIVEWQTSNGSPRRGLLQTFHPDHYQQWKTEALTLSRLQSKRFHPHIIECLWHSNSSKTRLDRGTGKDAAKPVYLERYICTTYYQHGSLQQFLPKFLDKFSESTLHSLSCQISQGLAFLHENNVVHTRLESTNIMVGGNPEVRALMCVCFWGVFHKTCHQ
ncbi:G-protein coupled receptor GRL101 [Strongylocentrotus purpuratus]|uniref:Protein kinase domain-containing protein n=1 Tax=Strongylocentrotus purpuratus TaxID=7668 RepID=A0A7M7PUH1_STRPU|nr:G-protein coupled receptor GRL101 [Strongylocentrotus purpuratus]